jgi:hypothetical protein
VRNGDGLIQGKLDVEHPGAATRSPSQVAMMAGEGVAGSGNVKSQYREAFMTSSSAATIVVGILGLAGVLLSTWANIRIKRAGDHAAEELEKLRADLTEAKEIRSERRSKQAAAETTVTRYREPLVGAAFEMQARIYNISTGRFFGADRSSYHVDHTLFVFAQYFGWREIILQEIQFMDFGDMPATKKLTELLERVTHTISATMPDLPANFQLFRGEQRAIGEKMMVSIGTTSQASPSHRCLGYASFVEALNRSDFDVWFTKLRAYLEYLESSDKPDFRRLSLLQNVLIDLIDLLDPDCVRTPHNLRNRMAMSPEVAALWSPK